MHVYSDEAAFARAAQGFAEGATAREFVTDLARGHRLFVRFDLVVVDERLGDRG